MCCCVSLLVSQQGRVAAGDGREALTGRAAPASGAGSAVSWEGPGPSPALAGPVHLRNVRGQRVEPGRATRARQRAARLLQAGPIGSAAPRRAGPRGCPGPARFPSLPLRAAGSVPCAEGSQLAVPLPAQTFLLWLPAGTRSLQ